MRACLAVLALIVALPGAAAQPATQVTVAASETAPNPVDEARVRALAETIRCVVCKNQSIADSDAGLARDLIGVLRERVAAGDSDAQATEYLVARYGEFVLLKPRLSAANALLWAAPAIIAALGLLAAIAFIRARRAQPTGDSGLTEAERLELTARLDKN